MASTEWKSMSSQGHKDEANLMVRNSPLNPFLLSLPLHSPGVLFFFVRVSRTVKYHSHKRHKKGFRSHAHN